MFPFCFMQNYFLLLGLNSSPAESNETVINKAILDLQIKAQHDMQNPQKVLSAQEIIAEIPKIKEVMHNDSLREAEAAKAIEEKKKILKDLDDYIKVISVKGYITTSEKKSLEKKFMERHLTKQDIEQAIHIPVEDRKNIFDIDENPGKIDSQFLCQNLSYMKALNCDDISLYSYYKIPETSTASQIVAAADASLKKIIQKGTKTNHDMAEQKISGSVKVFFKNPLAKKQYDYYLKGHRFQKLSNLTAEGILSTGEFSNSLYRILCQTAKDGYHMSTDQIGIYLVYYLTYEGIPYDKKAFSNAMDGDNSREGETTVKTNSAADSRTERKPRGSSFSPEQIRQLKQQRERLQQKKKQFDPIEKSLKSNCDIAAECKKNISKYKTARIKKLAYPTEREKKLIFSVFGGLGGMSLIGVVRVLVNSNIASNLKSIAAFMFLGVVGLSVFYILSFLKDLKIWENMCKKASFVEKNSKEIIALYQQDFISFANSGKSIDPSPEIFNRWVDKANKSNAKIKKTGAAYNEYVNISRTFLGGITKNIKISLGIAGGNAVLVLIIFLIGSVR